MTSRSATRPVHSVLGASTHSAQRSEQKDSFQFIGHSSRLDFDARPRRIAAVHAVGKTVFHPLHI